MTDPNYAWPPGNGYAYRTPPPPKCKHCGVDLTVEYARSGQARWLDTRATPYCADGARHEPS